jgi:hypothetical protein
MTVDFVAGMDSFQTQIVAFRQAMRGFTYTPGNNYLAFVQGDKVANIELTGLVVGGAAAIAAKAGLFKYLWKLIVAAVAGVGGLLKKLFSPRQDKWLRRLSELTHPCSPKVTQALCPDATRRVMTTMDHHDAEGPKEAL